MLGQREAKVPEDTVAILTATPLLVPCRGAALRSCAVVELRRDPREVG